MKFLKTFLASLLAFVIGSVVVCAILVGLLFGIPVWSSDSVIISENSILKIDFSEQITDSPSRSPWDNIDFATLESTPRLSLYGALRAIEAAKTDDRIEGIYIHPSGGEIPSWANLEELRAALTDFRRSGKFIVAYGETYGQEEYYLASVAEKIYLQPQGAMVWAGLSVTSPFFKGLFDKLDVRPEIFRPTECRYKSAVEPYFLTGMSPENRLQRQTVLESNWTVVCDAVSKSRGVTTAELNRLAENLTIALPDDAVKHRLVDSLIYEDRMEDVFAAYDVEPKADGTYRMISLGEYAANRKADLKNLRAPQVAILYAEGPIVDGEGNVDEIGGASMAEKLAEVRRDTMVKAVVVRVNSPGGSALASDVIWREMELLKAEKPVVVSMGEYAASGGYYISAPADAIVADKMTLTGSIGVFGMFLRLDEALKNNVGITFDTAKTHPSADMSALRPMSDRERTVLMRSIDKVYNTFIATVSAGRNIPLERVMSLAEGRVWSGTDAVANGLVDVNGGLDAAIKLAAEKAQLGENYRVVERIEIKTGLLAMLSGLTAEVKADMAEKELGVFAPAWRKVRELAKQQGILMYYPYE